jgi:hypothetical protein
MAIHFVGFKPSDTRRWASAVRVWGQPDFVHPYWDTRAYEDFDRSTDTMVISNPVHHNPKRSLPRSGVKTITIPEVYYEARA